MALGPDTSPETHAILGAAIEVQRELGPGFLEAVYQSVLARELAHRGIAFLREVWLEIQYKGEALDVRYKADFICGDVLLELKAAQDLASIHEAQVIHYLRATGLRTGLLVNFGVLPLQIRRLVLDLEQDPIVNSAASAFRGSAAVAAAHAGNDYQ